MSRPKEKKKNPKRPVESARMRQLKNPPSPAGRVMLPVYKDMDGVIAEELDELRRKGIRPSCSRGCYFCCRQHIPVIPPEAYAIADNVRRSFNAKQIEELRERVRAWLDWVRVDLPKLTTEKFDEQDALYNYGPYCPLLVDGACSVYAVRPTVCRTHYVSSDPRACRSKLTDPEAMQVGPELLLSIPLRASVVGSAIREALAAADNDVDESVMPLPRWLALAMDWDDLWASDE